MKPCQTEPGIPGATPDGDSAAWGAFVAAQDAGDLCRSWLELQARWIGEAVLGVILLRDAKGQVYLPAAIWPNPVADISALAEAARTALTERRGVELNVDAAPGGAPGVHVALPIETEANLYGVVVFALGPRPPAPRLAEIRRQLYWGMAWLADHFLREELRHASARVDHAAMVLDLALLALEKQDFQESLLALANALAVRLNLRRAAIGLEDAGHLKVKAISHTAHFKRQSAEVQQLEQCMAEAFDQGRDLHHPEPSATAGAGLVVTADHARLAEADNVSGVASFLLRGRGRPFGVLTLEYSRDRPPTADGLELGAALARLLAPALAPQRELDLWIAGKLRRHLRDGWHKLFGPAHATYKLVALSLALLLAVLVLAEGGFRVKANTSIEGLVQRAAVAPFEGYIGQALVRAGDRIETGQVLATLDDKDLQLEKIRLDSEREQAARKYRDALAKHERASIGVLGAQLEATEAQLNLVREKLVRAQVRAPFDGVVVSGDLSQMLGAPVEQGKVLFEIAPLDAYRVILKVDERDIAYVEVGQRGDLALSGITGEPQPFAVKKVTPVATAEEGINYFRVEAELDRANPLLRPGMEGVGKIRVGERPLWWIWTRRLTDWLRISLWTWLP